MTFGSRAHRTQSYLERCWPAAGPGQDFDFVRLIEAGDEWSLPMRPTPPVVGGGGTPRFSPSTTRTRSPVPRSTSPGTSSSRRCSRE
jgi:hypothetical protein